MKNGMLAVVAIILLAISGCSGSHNKSYEFGTVDNFHGISLASAPRTSKVAGLSDLFEEAPPGSRSYEMRKEVVVVYAKLDGTIYTLPKKNIFYVQHDPIGSSTRTFYGPFEGNPAKVMDFSNK